MLSSSASKAYPKSYVQVSSITCSDGLGTNGGPQMAVGPTGILYVARLGVINIINPTTGVVTTAYSGLSIVGNSPIVVAPNGALIYNNGSVAPAYVYAIGGPYSTETTLFKSSDYGNARPAMLAIDPTGTIIYCSNYGNASIQAFAYSAGTWSLTGYYTSTSPAYWTKLMAIAVDSKGTIWGMYPGIMYSQFTTGADWATIIPISPAGVGGTSFQVNSMTTNSYEICMILIDADDGIIVCGSNTPTFANVGDVYKVSTSGATTVLNTTGALQNTYMSIAMDKRNKILYTLLSNGKIQTSVPQY